MELHSLVTRIRAEFNEMPGLRLTLPQAQRLWGVDGATCSALLNVLVRSELLTRGADGRYRRFADDVAGSGAKMAKAAHRSRLLATSSGDQRRHL